MIFCFTSCMVVNGMIYRRILRDMKIIELDINWVVTKEYIKLMNMTAAEKKRKIVMDHVIRILRSQCGGNDGIHKIKIQ